MCSVSSIGSRWYSDFLIKSAPKCASDFCFGPKSRPDVIGATNRKLFFSCSGLRTFSGSVCPTRVCSSADVADLGIGAPARACVPARVCLRVCVCACVRVCVRVHARVPSLVARSWDNDSKLIGMQKGRNLKRPKSVKDNSSREGFQMKISVQVFKDNFFRLFVSRNDIAWLKFAV